MMRGILRYGFVAMVAMATATASHATTVIASSAHGLFSNVKLLSTVGVTIGPVAPVNGQTSPGYSLTNSVASVNSTVDLGILSLITAGLRLGTGVINTSATANGTTPADTTSGSASATIDDLGIELFTRTLGLETTTLGLTADTITSNTSVVRIGNVATLTGQSVLSNLNLSVLGLPVIGLGLNAQVTPNFVVYDLLGLRITLNQQTQTTSGLTRSLTTNAIHIAFNNFLLSGRTLTGEVVVGQSMASITYDPVPEPAAWAQMLAGFGLMGSIARRRRQQPVRATA